MRAGKRQLFYPLTDSYYCKCSKERKKNESLVEQASEQTSRKRGLYQYAQAKQQKKTSNSLHGACTKNIGTPTIYASQLLMLHQ
jgi:hypothetical protein